METSISDEDVRHAVEKLGQFRDSLPDAERAVVDLVMWRAAGGEEVGGFDMGQWNVLEVLYLLMHDSVQQQNQDLRHYLEELERQGHSTGRRFPVR